MGAEEQAKRAAEIAAAAKAATPEEKLAEKLRLQKIQEDADLQLANDLMGAKDEEEFNFDCIDISTVKGLDEFRRAIVKKIKMTERLEKKSIFVTFIEDLGKDLCTNIELDDMKKVISALNALYNEKVKASKPKNKKKGVGKVKLNLGQGAIPDDNRAEGWNEYDDFI